MDLLINAAQREMRGTKGGIRDLYTFSSVWVAEWPPFEK